MACRTFGGDGCAANCTAETTRVTVPVALRSATGLTEPPRFLFQAAGFLGPAGLHAARVPVALRSTQTFILGKALAGNIPVAVLAASIEPQPRPISVLACACVSNTEFETSGGTLFDEHGSPSVSCTPGFAAAPADCAAVGLPPCTTVHGPGNAASGFISCDGLRPVDLFVWQDSNTADAGENRRPQWTFRHSVGGPGSELVACAWAVGMQAASCQAWCTDSNPAAKRGVPEAFLFTTGQACSQVIHQDEAQ